MAFLCSLFTVAPVLAVVQGRAAFLIQSGIELFYLISAAVVAPSLTLA